MFNRVFFLGRIVWFSQVSVFLENASFLTALDYSNPLNRAALCDLEAIVNGDRWCHRKSMLVGLVSNIAFPKKMPCLL